MNVLIVEEDADQRELLTIYLRKAGCAVYAAARAEDALATVEQVQLDLAIVDAHLPHRGGGDVATRVRELRPACAVVLSSVLDRSSFPSVATVLPKPFTRADVLRLIPQQQASFIPEPRSGSGR